MVVANGPKSNKRGRKTHFIHWEKRCHSKASIKHKLWWKMGKYMRNLLKVATLIEWPEKRYFGNGQAMAVVAAAMILAEVWSQFGRRRWTSRTAISSPKSSFNTKNGLKAHKKKSSIIKFAWIKWKLKLETSHFLKKEKKIVISLLRDAFSLHPPSLSASQWLCKSVFFFYCSFIC